jgi:hypothetical protein
MTDPIVTAPLIEAIIEELEESLRKLSRLRDGFEPTYDGTFKYDGSITLDGSLIKKEGLEPIIEKLNIVIQDLKNSVARD